MTEDSKGIFVLLGSSAVWGLILSSCISLKHLKKKKLLVFQKEDQKTEIFGDFQPRV